MRSLTWIASIFGCCLIVGGTLFAFVTVYNSLNQRDPEGAPNIFVLTLSGVRNKDVFGDQMSQYMPQLRKICAEGVLYTNVASVNYPFHLPVTNAINTGMVYSYDYKAVRPSFFQYFNKQYRVSQSKTWAIGDWFVNTCVKEQLGFAPATFPCQVITVDSILDGAARSAIAPYLEPQEKETVSAVEKLLKQKITKWPQWDGMGAIHEMIFWKVFKKLKPKLVHYIMQDTEAAHYDSFARYIQMVKRCDTRIGRIMKYLNEDSFYRNNTYVFINADHERNYYYMQHHDLDINDPASSWLYIYGPDIQKGLVIDRKVYHMDIFATIAKILSLKTHKNFGRHLVDAFEDS